MKLRTWLVGAMAVAVLGLSVVAVALARMVSADFGIHGADASGHPSRETNGVPPGPPSWLAGEPPRGPPTWLGGETPRGPPSWLVLPDKGLE